MTAFRTLATVFGLLFVAGIVAAGWYAFSPGWALAALSDRNRSPAEIATLYDRERLYEAFDRQTLPQVADYPPPLTKHVVLTALTDPKAVRSLVTEPYGDWQFAAGDGLPPGLLPEDGQDGYIGRMLETTRDWDVERNGLRAFVARGGDRPDDVSHAYRFERDGLNWTLVAIELSAPIR